jgi:MoxR-like ATPase
MIAENGLKKLELVRAELKKCVFGRDDIIDAVILALAANEHILIEGKHGEAKSYAIHKLNEITALKSFSVQLHRETTLKDIVGMINPVEFQKGKLDIIKTKFWDANILFCDEFLRARSEFLDFLLEVMVERKTTKTVLGEINLPIISVIATTNPLTEEYNTERLDLALKDRFFSILRLNHMIETEEKQDSILQILSHMANTEIRKVELRPEELIAIPKDAEKIPMDNSLIINLFLRLKENNFPFSTRTIKLYKKIIQVNTLLHGDKAPKEEDIIHVSKLMLLNRFDKLTEEKLETILDDSLIFMQHKDLIDKLNRIEQMKDNKLFMEKAIEVMDETREEYNELPKKLQERIESFSKKLRKNILENIDSISPTTLAKLDTEKFKPVFEVFTEKWTIQTRFLSQGQMKQAHNIIKNLKYCEVEEKKTEEFVKYIIRPSMSNPDNISKSLIELKETQKELDDYELISKR